MERHLKRNTSLVNKLNKTDMDKLTLFKNAYKKVFLGQKTKII